MGKHLARHDDERGAVLPNAVADGASPIGVAARLSDAAAAAREIRSCKKANGPSILVDSATAVIAMTQRARERAVEMRASRDRDTVRSRRERRRANRIPLADPSFAECVNGSSRHDNEDQKNEKYRSNDSDKSICHWGS